MAADKQGPGQRKQGEEAGAELARKAARLIRDGRPRLKKLVDENRPAVEKLIRDNRPRAEQAGRNALRFAQEHEDEIKAAALKGARMRIAGPFGFLIDAVARASGPAPDAAPGPADAGDEATKLPRCSNCQTINSRSAHFCSECGKRLEPA